MTKADLVSAVAEAGMTKKEAAAAVDAVIGAIKGSLAKGEEVRLIGFGTFSVKKRKARTGETEEREYETISKWGQSLCDRESRGRKTASFISRSKPVQNTQPPVWNGLHIGP